MRHVERAGQSTGQHLDGRHEIETQQGEVGQVLIIQRFVIEVRMHEAHPSETVAAAPAQFREEETAGIPHQYSLDLAAPIQQQTDLPLDFFRDFGECARQFRCDDMRGMHASLTELVQAPNLGRLQAVCVAAEQVVNSPTK